MKVAQQFQHSNQFQRAFTAPVEKGGGNYLKANEAPAVRLLYANDSVVNFH
jgi:hypothetical protein